MEVNQNFEPLSATKEPLEYIIHVKVEHETEDTRIKEIKREIEFEEIEIKKDPDSPESKCSIAPVWFEVPVKREEDSPEIKYSNTHDNHEVEESAISEQTKPETATSSKENKSVTERKKQSGEKPYKCDTCDRRFTAAKYLKKHKNRNTGEKPFKCNACDSRFTFGSDLTKHMRTHTGEKPFKCQACDYRFAQDSSLKRHMRTHTGEKPYKCDACGHRFTSSSDLKRHMRSHTGERPFKCDFCDFRCTQDSNLKKHIRTHTQHAKNIEGRD